MACTLYIVNTLITKKLNFEIYLNAEHFLFSLFSNVVFQESIGIDPRRREHKVKGCRCCLRTELIQFLATTYSYFAQGRFEE